MILEGDIINGKVSRTLPTKHGLSIASLGVIFEVIATSSSSNEVIRCKCQFGNGPLEHRSSIAAVGCAQFVTSIENLTDLIQRRLII